MKKIAIVGQGRFAKVLIKLLENDFSVELFHGRENNKKKLNKLYNNEVIFYCVPISAFESVIKSHKKYFRDSNLLIDVLSVKSYPKKILEKYLKNSRIRALLTHPMFGPDSSKNGFAGLPIMIDRFKSNDIDHLFWKKYFASKGLTVVEIPAEEHDRLAASSQGLTHFVGRVLELYGFERTPIDTLGAKKLHEVMEQTCNDNLRLFHDLQTFNPYTKKMRLKLGKSYDRIYKALLPRRANLKHIIYGIQGGKGSFNEEATLNIFGKPGNTSEVKLGNYLDHTSEVNRRREQKSTRRVADPSAEALAKVERTPYGWDLVKKFRIEYLYTTEKVLKNLHEGNIDYGVFAIQNATGGLVTESAYAMAKYKFNIVEEFAIKIRHFLMKRKEVEMSRINSIMAHPQVFRQCRSTLSEKYPKLKLTSGKGDMIDTARAARALSAGDIPKTTAILGPKRLAEIYNLDIVDGDLQDDKDGNYTSFFLVSR